MKQAIALFGLATAALATSHVLFGYDVTYDIAYGVLASIALVIASTFLWLWWVRATPLALGMAFSWAGAALVLGWWWAYSLLGQPRVMVEHPALFAAVAAYLVGATMHLRVMQSTMRVSVAAFWGPIAALVGAVLAVVLSVR